MTIPEVSKKFELSKDTLRYFERVGVIPRAKSNIIGIRDYTEEDCKWFKSVKCMRDECRWAGFVKCMRSVRIPIETLVEYSEDKFGR